MLGKKFTSSAFIIFHLKYCLLLNLFVCNWQILATSEKEIERTKQIGNVPDPDSYTPEVIDSLYKYFYSTVGELQDSNHTISDYIQWSIAAKFHTFAYENIFNIRYDNYDELKQSGGPGANHEVCLKQLQQLIERAEKQSRIDKYQSRDFIIFKLMDTFGRPPEGSMALNSFYMGAYEECKQLELNLSIDNNNKKESQSTRYCYAKFKYNSWPHKSSNFSSMFDDNLFLSIGVCLPESCDSIANGNKYELIERLMDFNRREIDKNQSKLMDLYCLPDEKSPIRDWRQSRGATITIILFSLWFAIMIYATIKSSSSNGSSSKYSVPINLSAPVPDDSDEKNIINNNQRIKDNDYHKRQTSTTMKLYQSLSMIDNFRSLFLIKRSKGRNPNNNIGGGETREKIVDLSILNGIKVVTMIYLLTAHILMCAPSNIENLNSYSTSWSLPYQLANAIPAVTVNSFFAITGLLTSYSIMKSNLKSKSILKPIYWFRKFLNRYLRLMPIYLISVLCVKTLVKYTGSGPLWDYGTSDISRKRLCERESWLVPLLFKANTEPVLENCLPPAYYIANDFQFLLMTPIFLIALYLNPTFGKFLIKLTMVSCSIINSISIYSDSRLQDFRPIAEFQPASFKLNMSFFYMNYIGFQYRIPAYLYGLLIGFKLYKFEQDKLNYLRIKANKKEKISESLINNDDESELPSTTEEAEPKHSLFLRNYCTILSAATIMSVAFLPLTAKILSAYVKYSKFSARIQYIISTPLFHFIHPMTVGNYILLASTGYGNKSIDNFLSSPYWQPLNKLGLIVSLINIEVVNNIIQRSTRLVYYDSISHFFLIVQCMVMIYLTSIVVYILFEAPIQSLLKQIFKMMKKKK